MKYLKKYDFFKEVLAISTTDRPDEKLAKQSLNDVESDLKEYREKKPKIDQLYNSTKNDLEIEQELKKMFPEKENKNRFLVEYLKICRIQNEINRNSQARVDANINKDKYVQEKGLTKDPTSIKRLDTQLKEIDVKVGDLQKILAEKTKELQKLMAEHKKLMIDTEKELKKDTQEIQMKK